MVRFVLFIAWCVGNYVLGEIIIGPPSLILFLTVPYWVKPKVVVWTLSGFLDESGRSFAIRRLRGKDRPLLDSKTVHF